MLLETFNRTLYLSNQIHLGDEICGLKAARFLAKPVVRHAKKDTLTFTRSETEIRNIWNIPPVAMPA